MGRYHIACVRNGEGTQLITHGASLQRDRSIRWFLGYDFHIACSCSQGATPAVSAKQRTFEEKYWAIAHLLQSKPLVQCYLSTSMSDRDPDIPDFPDRWQEIQPDELYYSAAGQPVSFNQIQVQLGILYDTLGKHRAI